MLKKGDKVVMHTCGEAEYYYGQIWTCQYDQFNAKNGSPVVFLEGFSGYFLVEYLQYVEPKQIKDTSVWIRVIKEFGFYDEHKPGEEFTIPLRHVNEVVKNGWAEIIVNNLGNNLPYAESLEPSEPIFEEAVKSVEPVIINIPSVDTWTKTDLLFACKKNKVKGYTRMDKPQLIEAVKNIMANMKGEKL